MKRFAAALKAWIPLAIAITGICAVVYFVTQQGLRTSLNDPQLQLARDAASRLADGELPKVVAAGRVDIAASLAPWVIVFDDAGKPIAGAASLEGTVPIPPAGVFDYTRTHGEDRVTWQPREDVRIATVVDYWRGKNGAGFVVSGRNMREAEERIDTLGKQVAAGWLLTLAVSFIAAFGMAAPPRPPKPELVGGEADGEPED